jgi:hypothetical protein
MREISNNSFVSLNTGAPEIRSGMIYMGSY